MSKVTVGFFDGIHIGHQKLIQNIYPGILVTFDTSPKVFLKKINNCLLTTNQEKKEILSSLFPQLKVDFLIFKNIHHMSPEQFIKYLKQLYDFETICVGYDFRFGYKALGNIKTLQKLSKKFKYELIVQKPVYFEKRIVHSSLIRDIIANHPQKLSEVEHMLGRPYFITGIVIEGQKIGRQIGFPTANILLPPNKVIPFFGIYKSQVEILNNQFHNKTFEGLLYVGPRPVINNFQISIEVWIKDFNENIYYQPIRVKLLRFIRKIKNFKTLKAMVKQIEKDIELAFP
ncbi:MAG: riboflavin biosynthesis protein RibF [bacterium]